MKYELCAVKDPADPRRRLLIRAQDFAPGIHTPWEFLPGPSGEVGGAPATAGTPAKPKRPRKQKGSNG